MLFHTSILILRRLPQPLLEEAPTISTSEDVQICYKSLDTIIKLLKTFGQLYSYSSLPLDVVYILTVVVGTVFMRRIVEKTSFQDEQISTRLSPLLDVMDQVKRTWPCMQEISEGILHHIRNGPNPSQLEADFNLTPGLMADYNWDISSDAVGGAFDLDIGLFNNTDPFEV